MRTAIAIVALLTLWARTIATAEPVESAGILSPTLRLKGHTDSVTALDWSNDGKWIASGSVDRTVRLWDAATGKSAQVLKVFRGAIIEVHFSGDSKRIIASSVDGSAKVFETATGKQLAEFRFKQQPWRVALNHDGTRAAISTQAEGSGVYDVATEKQLFGWKEGWVAQSIAFSPDGSLIAVSVMHAGEGWVVSGRNNAHQLFLNAKGERIADWPVEAPLNNLRFDADSKFVFGSPSGKSFLRIDRDGPKAVAEASMDFDLGCDRLADNAMTTVMLPGGVVTLIRFDGPKAAVEHLQTTTADVRCGAISADGKQFALAPSDLPDGYDIFKAGRPAEKCLIDIYSSQSPKNAAAHVDANEKYYREGFSIVPGTATAWVPGNGPLQVIDLPTGKVLAKKPKRSNSYMAIALSADGRRAILSQPSGPAIIDTQTFTTLAKLNFSAARSIPQVMAAFVDDGKSVIVGNGAEWEKAPDNPQMPPRGLWALDAATGKRVGTLDSEQFAVWAIADDPKSRRLVATTATYMDGPAKAALRIYNTDTWAAVKVVPLPDNREYSKTCVVDGIAYACNGGDLVRYDLARDQVLEPIELRPNADYTDLAVSADRKCLLVGGNKIATLVNLERGERTKSFNFTYTGPRLFGFDGNRPYSVMLDDDNEQSWDFLWLGEPAP